jgi:hypothetical protein
MSPAALFNAMRHAEYSSHGLPCHSANEFYSATCVPGEVQHPIVSLFCEVVAEGFSLSHKSKHAKHAFSAL